MAEPRKPPPVTLEDLRPLLVGPEQSRIRQIEERLDHHMTEAVADVLPEAVAESRRRGEALEWALDPVVGRSFRRAIAKDPGSFADAIAPALGPGIRKAVSDALRVALQRFNEALDRTLSVESLRWRLEARRTGRPFAEVVLLHTLVYRVEQVFLIHRGTGLLLEHVAVEEGGEDPDQISAMLSALDTFAHEAFREDARLERFRVGSLTGWVEQGPSAILVAVVRGTAPERYESVLREAVERTHLEYGPALTDFKGDAAAFAGTREMLSACLKEHRELPRRRWRISPRVAGLVLVAMVLVAAGFIARRTWAERRTFAAYAGALQREPGYVVIASERRRGRPVFTGLRDPLAAEPAVVLARSGLDPAGAATRFEPYYSLAPPIVERRAQQILKPPGGVSLRYADGVLEARGAATRRWIDRARAAAPLLPGVTAFDDRRLHDQDAIPIAEAAAQAIGAVEVYFPAGSEEPAAGQQEILDGVARRARELHDAASAAGLRARIEVLGSTDATGSREVNEPLALARARRILHELSARGVPGDDLDARGAGVRAAEPGRRSFRARSVRFHVDLRPTAEERPP